MKIPGMKNGKASMRWECRRIGLGLVLVAGDNHWMAYFEEYVGTIEQNKGKFVAFIGAGDFDGSLFTDPAAAKEWIEKEIGMRD